MVPPICVMAPVAALIAASAQVPTVLDCTGPFARDADEATLAEVFGTANVKHADINVGEGFTEPGTIIFPEEPKRRIEITWHDPSGRRRPNSIRIRQGSAWRIRLPDQRRLAIGATLADVEAANGQPFTILGFGWDNGGYAAGWGNGALARPVGGCSMTLNFAADLTAGATLDAVSGDREFRSTDSVMRAVKPVVTRISLEWPE